MNLYDDVPAWNKENQEYPTDDKGNQLHYPFFYSNGRRIPNTWVTNSVFKDTLTYDHYNRGRSAAYFTFTRKSTGTQVTVFMRDMEKMLSLMVKGTITASFTFCKQGQNFGCKLAK